MNRHCLLTCPHCGHESLEAMPEGHRVEFHECDACHRSVEAKAGDCCVYRSYGDAPCPCVRAPAAARAAEARA